MKASASWRFVISMALGKTLASAHSPCGTHEPKWDIRDDEDHEISMFGRPVSMMSRRDLSGLFDVMKGIIKPDEINTRYDGYQLTDIPIVYHILPNQNNGGQGSPSLTDKQRDFATNMATQLYNIYNKKNKQQIQFATFVSNGTIVHEDIVFEDECGELSNEVIGSIVQSANEWQYKMHVIVCESKDFMGMALSFPRDKSYTSPLHNAILSDYRAFACHDEDGNFLCDLTNGTQISHTNWAASRSGVLAHEIGHIFGLFHPFQEDCGLLGGVGDGVPDTPVTKMSVYACPGLLPYDKDRDLFANRQSTFSLKKGFRNKRKFVQASDVCGKSGSGCCTIDETKGHCTAKDGELDMITEDANNFPICCEDPTPFDTCPHQSGIDPQNNIMMYGADFCRHEFTPGQMARMMSQILKYKDIIYCNYSTKLDNDKCNRIPCASTATSPNCLQTN